MGNAAMQYRSLSLITLALGLLALASARSPYRRAEYFHDFDDYLSVRAADLYAQKLELDHLRREVAQERAMLRDMNFQRLHAGHQYQQQPQQPQPQQPQPPQQPQQPQPPQPQQPQQQPKQAPTSCSSCGLFSFFVTLAFGTLVSKALFHGPCFLMGALPWVVLLALKLFFFSFLAATIFVPLLSFLGFLLWAAPLPASLVALFFLPDFKCVSRKWGSCGPRRCTATDSNNNAAAEGSSLPATPLARGARGPAVAKLQDILIQLGHLHPSAVRFAKGIYGPRTTAAIAALQARGDRTATGVYDEALRTQLQQALSDQQPTTRTPSQQERHWGVYCDKTNQPIVGHRYKMKGQNYDLCEAEFLKLNPAQQAGFECITKSRHRAPSFFGGAFPFVRFMQCPTPQAQPEQVPSATSAEFPSPPLFVDTARLPQESPAVSQHTVTDPAFLAFSESQAGSVEAAQATPAVNEVTADQRVALLTSMGFSAEEVAGALEATSGSLERAADWLFVNRQAPEPKPEPEPEFLPEWESLLRDLVEMGFVEPQARKQVIASEGNVKQAIKALVEAERQHQ